MESGAPPWPERPSRQKPARIFDAQAVDSAAMLKFTHKATSLSPRALIAMQPYGAKSLDEYRASYRAHWHGPSGSPFPFETTTDAKSIERSVDLTREFAYRG